MRYNKRIITIIFLTVVTVGFYSCDDLPFLPDTEPPSANTRPETTIANVPKGGDTLFANVTLHWDGGDNDGFVVNYEWQYATVDPQTGDTLKGFGQWMSTDQTSLTLTFSSPQPLNKQIFRVRAVDNSDDKSVPATKIFYTEQTIPPEVSIATPSNDSERLYIPEQTDWFQGILLTFEGEDEDGEIQEYGWAVDGGEYQWTSDTSVTIHPNEFETEGSPSDHIIRLTARDDTDLTSDDPDTVSISLVQPTFENEVLVIDETDESSFQNSGNNHLSSFSDDDVDSMYSSWIDPTENDEWDFGENGMPPREVIGQYQMVIWHADNHYTTPSAAHNIGNHTDILSEYMNVGGDFIMSGWKILKALRPQGSSHATFQDGDFEYDYLHIAESNVSGNNPPGDMIGATGMGEYPSVTIDSAKIDGYPLPFFSDNNMAEVNYFLDAAGFTSTIYRFECRPDCGNFELRDQSVGIRYFGTSFDAVVFGFPMFFMKEEDAAQAMNQLMINMGYRNQQEKTIR